MSRLRVVPLVLLFAGCGRIGYERLGDATPTLTLSPASVSELTEGSTRTITILLDRVSERDVTFDYGTVAGTATAGSDYTEIPASSALIPAGSTLLTVEVDALEDADICEPYESYTFFVRNIVNAQGDNSSVAVSIRDADSPAVTIADASGTEGSPLTFEVSLDLACPSNPITFDYFTVDETAIAGVDYPFTEGSVVIPAGQTTGSFEVATFDDSLPELPEESFAIGLRNLSSVLLGPDSVARGTIADDDAGAVTVKVVVHNRSTCALSSLGTVKCWGRMNHMGYAGGHVGDQPGEMGDNLMTVDLGTNDDDDVHTVQMVAGGTPDSTGECVVLGDGRVKCWGSGLEGRPTNNAFDTFGDNLPYVDLGTVDGLGVTPHTARFLVGTQHARCALLDDGRVKCWGTNHFGQLGMGDTNSRGGSVSSMGDNLAYVDLGTNAGNGGQPHTAKTLSAIPFGFCAVLDDDRVKCWGLGEGGQLGSGNIENLGDEPGEMGDNLPYVNLGSGRTVKALSYTCALLDNDRVKCWGRDAPVLGIEGGGARGDEPGEMGDNLPYLDLGTNANRGNQPHTVKAIDRGPSSHACAILEDDRLKCWGQGKFGALGSGDATNRGTAAGTMGDNLPYVDLGTGRTAERVFVVGSSGPATFVLRDDGTTVSFGRNQFGILGQESAEDVGDEPGEMGNNLIPVDFGTGLSLKQLTQGVTEHPCAVLSDDRIKCWGWVGMQNGVAASNAPFVREQLGVGDEPGEMGASLLEMPLPAGRSATNIFLGIGAYGGGLGFLVLDNGSYLGWGRMWGIRGMSTGDSVHGEARDAMQLTFSEGQGAIKLGGDWRSACAIDNTFQLRCMGYYEYSTVLNGAPVGNGSWRGGDPDVPPSDLGTYKRIIDLAVGRAVACGLLNDATVKCWGVGDHGQLGSGSTDTLGESADSYGDNLPVVDLGTVSYPVSISAGTSGVSPGVHFCARFANGGVKCWGHNHRGQLGLGDTNDRGDEPGEMGDALPFLDLGTGRTAKAIACGSATTCAILDNDTIKCWGGNWSGELGVGGDVIQGDEPGEMGDDRPAIDLNGDIPVQLAMSYDHVCALMADASLKCWGGNFWGELGLSDVEDRGDDESEMGASLPAVDIQW